MDEYDDLRSQLRKLSAAAPLDDSLGQVLEIVWSSRKTGLASDQKSTVHSLLNLPSVQDIHPVLACLRSIIRRTLNDNLDDDNIRMLFPVDISDKLQSGLVSLLSKYRNQWNEEASRDQCLSQQLRVSKHNNVTDPPALIFSKDSTFQHDHKCIGDHTDLKFPYMNPVSTQPVKQVVLPQLTSMTWTVKNRSADPTKRVAFINLKLQDNTKSPSGEMEIKFYLSKDTLEAMLRSMTYIIEQLSQSVTLSSQTANVQKQ